MILAPGDTFDGIYNNDDLEGQVKRYMSTLMDITGGVPYQKFTHIPKRVKIPEEFNTVVSSITNAKIRKEAEKWWDGERDRIANGHEGMCGLQYFYYNRYMDKKVGHVDFRRHDNEVNSLWERCIYGDLKGKGMVYIGRRREGKSNKMGNLMNHQVIRRKGITMVISSKTEDDAADVILQGKVMYAFDRLPIELKPDVLKRSGAETYFARKERDAKGNVVFEGKHNHIIASTPKSVAIEGNTLAIWIHDEAGKTENLQSLADNSLPALADAEGFKREGFALIVGVAGDFDKHGDDFKMLFNAGDSYDLIRYFSPGWSGGNCDPFGNEDIEATVRWILKNRIRIIKNKELKISEREKRLNTVMQQYPLTVEEALLNTAGCKFDAKALEDQDKWIIKNGFELMRGETKFSDPAMKMPVYTPDLNGQVYMAEPPMRNFNYIAGIDCYGLKRQEKTGSSGATVIYKMDNKMLDPLSRDRLMANFHELTPEDQITTLLTLGGLPVAFYSDGPKNPKTFAKKSAALIRYYQYVSKMSFPLKTLIEREPPIIFDYFDTHHNDLIAMQPLKATDKMTYANLTKPGMDMKEYWAEKRLEMLNWFVNNHVDKFLFRDVISLMLRYNDEKPDKKYDEVDGLGLALILNSDPRIQKLNRAPKVNKGKKKSVIGFRRM